MNNKALNTRNNGNKDEGYAPHLESSKVICFIGAGPNTLYCLERLVTHIRSGFFTIPRALRIAIYDKSASFGPGTHSSKQPKTNHLNRTAEQVSFGADPSHGVYSMSVQQRRTLTLHEWARDRYDATGESKYDILPQQWVERRLLGEALAEFFALYISDLEKLGVAVDLYPYEAVDIVPDDPTGRWLVRASHDGVDDLRADFVFLCTGHTESSPSPGSIEDQLQAVAKRSSFSYVHSVYPVDRLTKELVPSGAIIGCLGMGLAAIDCINWLTEGRGGQFKKNVDGTTLSYTRSGHEPLVIYPTSGSGTFVNTRAYNQKGNHAEKRHSALVFSTATFDAIKQREAIGTISLEDHLSPLLAIETILIYYRTLIGRTATASVERGLWDLLDSAIDRPVSTRESPCLWEIYNYAENQFAVLLEGYDKLLNGEVDRSLAPEEALALKTFINVRLGPLAAAELDECTDGSQLHEARRLNAEPSPWMHSQHMADHIFYWNKLLDPMSDFRGDGRDLHERAVAWLQYDILQAAQGNISNPTKAAVDGAFRDLRHVFRTQVEFGATGARDTELLYSRWYRIMNRLAVGTSIDVMAKVLALAKAKVVDFSYSKDLKFLQKIGEEAGTAQTAPCFPDVVINAKVHRFNLRTSTSPLYQNLYRRGIAREWNASDSDREFAPGALDVDRITRQLIDSHGRKVRSIAALGAPVDGPFYYRLALSRPCASDTVMFDADQAVCGALEYLFETA